MNTYLIFALDGTLLYVAESVYGAIRRTVSHYLTALVGLRGRADLLTLTEITHLQAAGLTDAVSLSEAVLLYYCQLIRPMNLQRPQTADDTRTALRQIRATSAKMPSLTLESLRERANIIEWAEQVKAMGGGMAAVHTTLDTVGHSLLYSTGDLTAGNVVARLYHEIYFGPRPFVRHFRQQATMSRAAGLTELESLTLSQQNLHQLQTSVTGIAAYSPRTTAALSTPLEQLGLRRHVAHIVTAEDAKAEQARQQRLTGAIPDLLPPHPFLIEEAVARLQPSPDSTIIFYGATPADIAAARAVAGEGGQWQIRALVPEGVEGADVRGLYLAAGADEIITQISLESG